MSQSREGFRGGARLDPRQDRSEVKTVSIHMHLFDPVMEAVEDQAAHDRVAGIQRITATGVVSVLALVGSSK